MLIFFGDKKMSVEIKYVKVRNPVELGFCIFFGMFLGCLCLSLIALALWILGLGSLFG